MTNGHHEHSNGDGPLWVRVLFKYGVPSAIAVYLTYALVGDVSGNIKAMSAQIQGLSTDHQQLRFFLRAICFNTAMTENQRAACVPSDER